MKRQVRALGALMVGVSGLAWASAASAQAVSPDTAPAPQEAGTRGAVAGETIDDGTLQDIVVTAQRREANLQTVPVAVTAADSAALAEARVDNIANVSAITPSVTFRVTNNAVSSSSIQIRGIGTSGNSRSFEGAVGVFIDGVYRTRSGQALQTFLDVDSLQILRGPQGTLFGKNTTAGAVLVTSVAPSLDRVTGNAQIDYANYDTLIAKAAISAPINDKVAVRAAGLYRRNDGFYRDPNNGKDYNDDETYAGKLQLRLAPTDDLDIRLIGDFARSNGRCCYGTADIPNAGPTQAIVDNLIFARGLQPPSRDKDRYEAVLSRDGNQRVTDYGATLLVDWDIGDNRLSSITGLRRYRFSQIGVDADFSGADIFYLDETFRSNFFSQELTFTGELDGALKADYVVGAFFSDEKIEAERRLYLGTQAQTYFDILLAARGLPAGTAQAPAGQFNDERMRAGGKSYAAFTNWDVKLTDAFSVIAGVRYTREEKYGSFRNAFFTALPRTPFRLLGAAPGPAYSAQNDRNALSGTAGVQYRPSQTAMFYATYNRGFKAGGVNIDQNAAGGRANNPDEVPGGVPRDPRFAPETVDSYEVGAKLDLFDRRARLNIAAFHSDIRNLQVAQFLGVQFAIFNAQRAKVTGVEGEGTLRIGDALTLNASGTWLPEAKYGVDPLLGPPLSGRRFAATPKFQGNVGVNLDKPVNDDYALVGRVQVQYVGPHFTTTVSNATQDEYAIVNLNIGAQAAAGWRLEFYVTNLFDEITYARHFLTPLQTGDQNVYLGPPRQYGLSLRYSF
ncbi:MAG: TonB-dependent receptor [Sphingomonas adhaesiva]|uniref:TonB-dependent receptor n=1 Tax=Sphingomonas adhaesiva TaxID=28212 RepID=UPI002FF82302